MKKLAGSEEKMLLMTSRTVLATLPLLLCREAVVERCC